MMGLVYTADSPIHGTGVFSSAYFSPGEIVLKVDDSRVVTDADPLDPARGEFEHHCDYPAGGRVVLMRTPERSINHRCDPNSYFRTIAGGRYVVALKVIQPGDEITCDYGINGDGDTEWDCTCGSPACRKRHLSGFFHLPDRVQARYLALLEDWFVAEHREEVDDLKRRVEAMGEAGRPPGGPSPARAGRPIDAEGHGHPGVVLVVNPAVSGEGTSALFGAAWGEQAPDSPPALDRCLAHVAAYQGGRLVGFVKLAWDGGIHAFLLDTTVHPDHQRRGIGRRLVDRAAEVAEKSGVEWLHVDFEPHLGPFYARCGFRPTPAGLMRLGAGAILWTCLRAGDEPIGSPSTTAGMREGTPVDILPFHESDEAEAIALWGDVFGYDAPHNDPSTVIRHKLACQRELFFVARVDGRLVGTVMGGYDGHRGWVYALAVDPERRRRGIGTALIRHVERELAARGCPKVNLQVLASNAATVAFYEKLGYAVEERISMGKLVEPISGESTGMRRSGPSDRRDVS